MSIAVMAAVAVIGLLWVRPGPLGSKTEDGRHLGGPINAGDATAVGTHRQPGDVLTFGHVIVSNDGRKAAVLEAVNFEPRLPPNLTLLGIQIASDPGRRLATVGRADGYPPNVADVGSLIPLAGAVVPPKETPEGDRGAALIMGFRFEGGDLASFRRVLVDYRIGDKPYRARLDKVLLVCSAITYPSADDCPDWREIYPPD